MEMEKEPSEALQKSTISTVMVLKLKLDLLRMLVSCWNHTHAQIMIESPIISCKVPPVHSETLGTCFSHHTICVTGSKVLSVL